MFFFGSVWLNVAFVSVPRSFPRLPRIVPVPIYRQTSLATATTGIARFRCVSSQREKLAVFVDRTHLISRSLTSFAVEKPSAQRLSSLMVTQWSLLLALLGGASLTRQGFCVCVCGAVSRPLLMLATITIKHPRSLCVNRTEIRRVKAN